MRKEIKEKLLYFNLKEKTDEKCDNKKGNKRLQERESHLERKGTHETVIHETYEGYETRNSTGQSRREN